MQERRRHLLAGVYGSLTVGRPQVRPEGDEAPLCQHRQDKERQGDQGVENTLASQYHQANRCALRPELMYPHNNGRKDGAGV
jgi:hypothetical protein